MRLAHRPATTSRLDRSRIGSVPVPFYDDTAWFLLFGGAFYKAKDRFG
ncbi:hypothetical protein [Streptomyces cellulosae]|uniref:Uncharacterized protein n=1 Tax=Streptomyces cellulosae TaxID=1968 RepID=A0ABW7XTZ3_STRCE